MSDWFTILAAFLATIPGVYAILANRRKVNAETVKTMGDDLRATNAQIVTDNQRLRQNLTDFDERLKCLRVEMAEARAACDAEIAALRETNAGLRADVETLRGENADMSDLLKRQGQRITELETENETLKAGVELLTQQVERLGETPAYRLIRKR
ncbi:MAG: hypothetical protein BWY63_01434 [Chloroflexi bacterium ADurb.Bin360]|nr:MAG: hypothetical protein BWY63_01434 [Chloroflexi bacterium ADurb.Bin360]